MRRSSLRSYCDYLEDILQNIQDIQGYLSNKSLDDLIEDSQLRKAVLFSFQTIGEATGKLPDTLTQQYGSVPWQKLKSFRNHLVHAYFNVNEALVWGIFEEHLPVLKEQIEHILQLECTQTEPH